VIAEDIDSVTVVVTMIVYWPNPFGQRFQPLALFLTLVIFQNFRRIPGIFLYQELVLSFLLSGLRSALSFVFVTGSLDFIVNPTTGSAIALI
jgi:hypothetical protein